MGPYITKQAAAETIGCHVRTIDRAIARNEIPTLKLSASQQGKVRIPLEAFQAWLAARTGR